METSPVLLECRQVSKRFAREGVAVTPLVDVNLTLRRGEIAVIGGRSGAGKSTLLSLLAGMDRPTSGEILLEGRHLELLTSADLATLRRTQLGLIFQNFNLLPSWTAYENVEAALLHSGMPAPEREARVMALLEALGIATYAHHLPVELSVGQQQRVAVARTLIHQPALILADEPTGDVDPETAGEILDLLYAPVRAGTATLLVTTHGHFPLDQADTVYTLQHGTLTLHTPAEV